MLTPRHQHQDRLGFIAASQVPKIGILPIGVMGVAATHTLGRSGQNQDRPIPCRLHQLLAPPRKRFAIAHRSPQRSMQALPVLATQYAIGVQQQHGHAQVFFDFGKRFLVIFLCTIIQLRTAQVGQIGQCFLCIFG